MPYDFTDEGVYALVKGTHRPTEIGGMRVQTLSGYAPETIVDPLRLICEKDGEDWPCAAVQQLRTFDETKLRAKVFEPRAPESEPNLSSRGSRG